MWLKILLLITLSACLLSGCVVISPAFIQSCKYSEVLLTNLEQPIRQRHYLLANGSTCAFQKVSDQNR